MSWWTDIRNGVEDAAGAVAGAVAGTVLGGAVLGPVGSVIGTIAGGAAGADAVGAPIAAPATAAPVVDTNPPDPTTSDTAKATVAKASTDEDKVTSQGMASTILAGNSRRSAMSSVFGSSATNIARTVLLGS